MNAGTHVGHAFQRAIAAAIGEIDAPGGLSREGAHEARRSLKRARAALRLVRPAFAGTPSAGKDALLRDCARSVAPVRDADVLLETFARLRKRFERTRPVEELAPIAQFLQGRRDAATTNVSALARAADTLRAFDDSFLMRTRHPVDAVTLEKGMRAIYRRGRKAHARACDAPTAASLHRWRKQAKYFADAVDALGDAATIRQFKRASLARQIAGWLGENHDLAMLADVVREHGDMLSPPARQALRRLLDSRQRKLCRRALRAGRRLYRAKPRRVAALRTREHRNAIAPVRADSSRRRPRVTRAHRDPNAPSAQSAESPGDAETRR